MNFTKCVNNIDIRLTSSPMGSAVALKAAALVSGQMQAVPMMSGPVTMSSTNMMPQNSTILGPGGNQVTIVGFTSICFCMS